MHNPENIINCELVPKEAHCYMLLLSQQFGLGLLNCGIWNFNSLKLLVLTL